MATKRKHKGIKSFYVFIPTIILISLLYTLILVSTVVINVNTTRMYDEINSSTECSDLINDMQGGCSKLSEVATAFIYAPENPNPAFTSGLNEGTLKAYLEEYENIKMNPDYILEEIKKYEVPDEVMGYLNKASDNYKYMKQEQIHSFKLLNSVSTINLTDALLNVINVPENNFSRDLVDKIEAYELSTDELGYSDDQKREVAFSNLLRKEYASDAKGDVSKYLRLATSKITENANTTKDKETMSLKLMRGFLWGGILLILIINAMFFYVLLRRLVLPINRYAKRIDNNERLDSGHALFEANVLADAYNSLLDRHKEFENELIQVAEIDSLTRLPNRYCYNNFLKNKVETEEKSVCALLFDINNLKYTNDTFGHAKGDELIKNAANCIKECFSAYTKNCFRIGGDEFVCILENIDEETINKYLSKFSDLEDFYNVSIAVGYSYIADIREVGYEKLISEADQRMYENKAKMRK